MKRILIIIFITAAFAANASATCEAPDSVEVSASQLADMIVSEASKMMGTPYRYGANGPKAYDCSAFTGLIYGKFGYKLKRSAAGQATDGRAVEGPISNLQKGDIIVFGGRKNTSVPGHVGIFIALDESGEDFTFIHTAVKGGVQINNLKMKYYADRFLGARRILPDFVKPENSDSSRLEMDVENYAEPLKDTLQIGENGHRVALLDDGTWVFVNADGTIAVPEPKDRILLEPNGKWSMLSVSRKKVPGAVQTDTAETSTNTSSAQSSAASSSAVYHTIKSGDTLSALAVKYHTSVSAICRLNGITTSTTLRIGKQLRVK